MSRSNLVSSGTMTALLLVLAAAFVPACRHTPKTPAAALPAWTITCPSGTPGMKARDARTLEFTCPDGSKPVKTPVAPK